jgi:hypothetical protein
MAMGAGNLARHHDLDVGDERVAGRTRQFGAGQAQDPAFGLRGTDQLGRSHGLWPQISPMPQVRHGLAARLDADAAADPGRGDVLRAELRVMILQLFLRGLDVRNFQYPKSFSYQGVEPAQVERQP